MWEVHLNAFQGNFQVGGLIFRQPRSQGLSLTTWGGKGLGNKVDLQALFIIQDGGHVKIPHPGDMPYDQNPHPGDRPHSQSPVHKKLNKLSIFTQGILYTFQ